MQYTEEQSMSSRLRPTRVIITTAAVIGLGTAVLWWAFAGRPVATSHATLPTPTGPPAADAATDRFTDYALARPGATSQLKTAPLYAIDDLRAALPAADAWLADFDRGLRQDGPVVPPSAESLERLNERLDAAPAPRPHDALGLSQLLAFWSGPDASARTAPFRFALSSAARDLSNRRLDDPAAADALAVLAVLPDEGWWQSRDGVALERLFRLRISWLNPKDGKYGWARAGIAGALYLQGRHAEALAVTDTLLGGNGLSQQQQVEVQWNRGLIFYAQGKPDQAIAPLRITATDPRFHHADEARQLLMYAHAQCGDSAATITAIKDYLAWRPELIGTAEQKTLVQSLQNELVRARQTGRTSTGAVKTKAE